MKKNQLKEALKIQTKKRIDSMNTIEALRDQISLMSEDLQYKDAVIEEKNATINQQTATVIKQQNTIDWLEREVSGKEQKLLNIVNALFESEDLTSLDKVHIYRALHRQNVYLGPFRSCTQWIVRNNKAIMVACDLERIREAKIKEAQDGSVDN